MMVTIEFLDIFSMLGHSVVGIMNFYSASKFALDAATQGLSQVNVMVIS
jgi:short-subunit dehydrogenase